MSTVSDRSPVTELPPILPPITCTSWCEHSDGHPGMRHNEDQSCESEEARTYLHLRKYNDDDQATYVTTYVERRELQATPHVHLGVDIDTGVKLTPAEARQLGRSLLKMARLARLPQLQIAASLRNFQFIAALL
jgi:hypothetical protein